MKNPIVIHPGRGMVERPSARYLELSSKLDQTQREVVEYEKSLKDLLCRKEAIEAKANGSRAFVTYLEGQVTTEINECSARLLKPILHNLQNKLPLELREVIYGYLVDIHVPRVVPKSEEHSQMNMLPRRGNVEPQMDINPFRDEYLFDVHFMESDTSNEIRAYFLKRTPLYFRGSHFPDDLTRLLDLPTLPRRKLRDLIRHLRVYLRCEALISDTQALRAEFCPPWLSEDEKIDRSERQVYDGYRARLEVLRNLPYKNNKIKLEVCIFYNSHHFKIESTRNKYNILEAVKSTYFNFKNAGGDMTVRYEDYSTGEGRDVTWELELDRDAWEKRGKPCYILHKQDETPSRQLWLEKIAAARDTLPEHDNATGVSWKHGLFNGPFPYCRCAPCIQANDLAMISGICGYNDANERFPGSPSYSPIGSV